LRAAPLIFQSGRAHQVSAVLPGALHRELEIDRQAGVNAVKRLAPLDAIADFF